MKTNFKKGRPVPGISLPLSQSKKSTKFLIFFQEDCTYEVINLNGTRWPKDFTVERKMSLCRGDIVDFCLEGRNISSLVVKKVTTCRAWKQNAGVGEKNQLSPLRKSMRIRFPDAISSASVQASAVGTGLLGVSSTIGN